MMCRDGASVEIVIKPKEEEKNSVYALRLWWTLASERASERV